MESRLNAPVIDRGTIPQPIMVVGALLFCLLVYGFSIGTGSGRELEGDRLVVAECWNAIARKSPGPAERQDMSNICSRMERGFHLKHGATP